MIIKYIRQIHEALQIHLVDSTTHRGVSKDGAPLFRKVFFGEGFLGKTHETSGLITGTILDTSV